MHAWVLILAVLATFKPIIQVVSTEDNNLNFIETSIIHNNKNEANNINFNNKTETNHNNITSSPVTLYNINKNIIINNNNNINSNINKINSNSSNKKNFNNINNNSQNKLDIIRIENFNKENNSTSINNNKLTISKNININNNSNIISNNHNDEKKYVENFKTNNNIKESENIHIKKSEIQINYDKIENENINSNNNNNDNNNLKTNDNNDKLKPDPETLVQIETSLLSLFGLKKPPKIDRSKIVIPEAMKRLYAQIMGNEFDSVTIPKPGLHTHSANTVRSFTHESTDIDHKYQHHHKFRLFFDVNSIPTEEKLKAAELQITRDKIDFDNPNAPHQRQRFRVSVYDIIRIGNKNNNNYYDKHDIKSFILLDTKTIYLNSSETLSLDVHSAVNRWLESPDNNNGLLIEVKTARTLKPAKHNHVRLRRSLDETHDKWLPKQPLLFTYTDDGRHKPRLVRDVSQRSKRAHHSRNGHHRRKNTICQRRPLYVDFNDVGWSDWIVAPPGYDAYYCQGDCPFPLADHLNSTNHAVVQTLVNNITPAKVPKACCIPTQLSAISMLYLNDQNQVVLKNYQDMTVVGCGCR